MLNRSYLVALALIAACNIPDVTFAKVSADAGVATGDAGGGDHMVTAHWSFRHLANNAPRGCPTGFGSAAVLSQAVDPITLSPIGNSHVDLFDCADLQGTILLSAGSYVISVRIQNGSGSQIYAESKVAMVATSLGDSSVDVEVLDDAGYFSLTWSLHDKATGALMTCAQAGATAVEVVSTGTLGPLSDKFLCDQGSGITAGLLAGSYTVAVRAMKSDLTISDTNALTGIISAPNGVTDLGHVMILIPASASLAPPPTSEAARTD